MHIFDFLGKKEVIREDGKTKIELFSSNSVRSLQYKLLAYSIATSYIKASIKNCEINVFENGERKKNHLYYLLNKKPNNNENASYFKDKLLDRLLRHGEVLVVPYKENLYVADSYYREENYLTEDLFLDIYIGDDYIPKKNARDAFFFRIEEEQIKTYLFQMFNDYDNIMDSAVDSYIDKNSKKYKLKISSIDMDNPEEKDKYEKFINEDLGKFLKSKKSVLPEYDGYDLQTFDEIQNNSAKDVIDLKKDAFETASEAFHIPIGMFYGNVTNVNDLITSFLTFSIKPIIKMICEEIESKYFSEEDILKGNKITFALTDIVFKDIFMISDKVEKILSSGINNIDEIREKLGEEPLNTDWSKQHWMTKNFDKIETILKNIEKEGDKNEKQ